MTGSDITGVSVVCFDRLSSITVNGSWSCSVSTDCQDVFDIDIFAGNTVNINVTNVTGSSVVRMAVFAPGVALTGPNLLNGGITDQSCTSQNASASTSFSTTLAGVYRIAIGRDWGSSAGSSGTYTLTVTSSPVMLDNGQTVKRLTMARLNCPG